MHELPKELAKSLHSWRGSVVRDSADLERGDYRDDHTDDGVHDEKPSATPILPPTPRKRPQGDNLRQHHWGGSPIDPVKAPSPVRDEPPNLADSRITDHMNGSPTAARRATTFDKQTYQSNKRSVFDQARVNDLDGAASRLDDDPTPLTPAEFYELMGMAPLTQGNAYPKNFALPGGLFAKIKEAYDAISIRYHMFNILTYVLMTLQLLLSAVFIILGSLGNVDSHLAVAVLGAIGTVVAGILALMKGQGLPNRLRQGRDSLGMVLFEAQELWWDVGAGRAIIYKDIRKVREDYLRVMDDQRRNHPDNWNPSTNKIAAGPQISTGRKAGWTSKLTLPLTR